MKDALWSGRTVLSYSWPVKLNTRKLAFFPPWQGPIHSITTLGRTPAPLLVIHGERNMNQKLDSSDDVCYCSCAVGFNRRLEKRYNDNVFCAEFLMDKLSIMAEDNCLPFYCH